MSTDLKPAVEEIIEDISQRSYQFIAFKTLVITLNSLVHNLPP